MSTSPDIRRQGFLARAGDRVKPGFAAVLRLAPGAFDPSLLFQSHQRRIQCALIQIQQIFGNLLEPRRDRIGVLRAHGLQRPQYDQVERSLQYADAIALFTGHPSGPQVHYESDSLGCQVEWRGG